MPSATMHVVGLAVLAVAIVLACERGVWYLREAWRIRRAGVSLAHPACPRCLYAFRGWAETTCPECGTDVRRTGLCIGARGHPRGDALSTFAWAFLVCWAVLSSTTLAEPPGIARVTGSTTLVWSDLLAQPGVRQAMNTQGFQIRWNPAEICRPEAMIAEIATTVSFDPQREASHTSAVTLEFGAGPVATLQGTDEQRVEVEQIEQLIRHHNPACTGDIARDQASAIAAYARSLPQFVRDAPSEWPRPASNFSACSVARVEAPRQMSVGRLLLFLSATSIIAAWLARFTHRRSGRLGIRPIHEVPLAGRPPTAPAAIRPAGLGDRVD